MYVGTTVERVFIYITLVSKWNIDIRHGRMLYKYSPARTPAGIVDYIYSTIKSNIQYQYYK